MVLLSIRIRSLSRSLRIPEPSSPSLARKVGPEGDGPLRFSSLSLADSTTAGIADDRSTTTVAVEGERV